MSEPSNLKAVKFLVVGSPGTGKRSLVHAFGAHQQPLFAQDPANNVFVSITFTTLSISPGPAVARALDDIYGIIYVYSITEPSSFDAIQREWIPLMPAAPVSLLIGTHRDAGRDGRKVSYTDAERLASTSKLKWMEVSNTTKTNIDLVLRIVKINTIFAVRHERAKKKRSIRRKALEMENSDSEDHVPVQQDTSTVGFTPPAPVQEPPRALSPECVSPEPSYQQMYASPETALSGSAMHGLPSSGQEEQLHDLEVDEMYMPVPVSTLPARAEPPLPKRAVSSLDMLDDDVVIQQQPPSPEQPMSDTHIPAAEDDWMYDHQAPNDDEGEELGELGEIEGLLEPPELSELETVDQLETRLRSQTAGLEDVGVYRQEYHQHGTEEHGTLEREKYLPAEGHTAASATHHGMSAAHHGMSAGAGGAGGDVPMQHLDLHTLMSGNSGVDQQSREGVPEDFITSRHMREGERAREHPVVMSQHTSRAHHGSGHGNGTSTASAVDAPPPPRFRGSRGTAGQRRNASVIHRQSTSGHRPSLETSVHFPSPRRGRPAPAVSKTGTKGHSIVTSPSKTPQLARGAVRRSRSKPSPKPETRTPTLRQSTRGRVPGRVTLPGSPGADEPVIYIDVNIGDGRVGQIGVRRDDNAFLLAEQFVRTFDLDRSHIRRLATMIIQRINAYLEAEARRRDDERRRLFRERARGQRVPGNGTGSPCTTTRPYQFQERRKREPLIRLKLELGNGKSGLIAVREGDDPHKLAASFIKTFQLKGEMFYEIVAKIQEHLSLYYLEHMQE
eukprot:gnl/Dysnectes_brevis/5663_a8270_296.p1 GENE.gnl/Dysnectes_brevis/5663_a8270_296~~gnl/Dysnectes_brevis/5663_a8270_296.p1  ORF type:complete len:785 (-),score=265.58 gnl/Dysnectes_brevis/5663_a8270_296:20-2374(-)